MGIEEVLEKGKDQSQRMEEDYLGKRGRVHLRERQSMIGDSGVVLGMVRSRLKVLMSNGSQSVVPRLAASASPRDLLEIQILWPHPRSESENLRVELTICFNKPSR